MFVKGPILEIPLAISQTYFLLAASIACYLFGAYTLSSSVVSVFGVCFSFALIFVVIATDNPWVLFAFAFATGVSHNPFFEYMNVVDPTIVQEALAATCILFFGLTWLAFTSSSYNSFVFCGLLYACLSNLIFMIFLNIFFQNTLLELFIMYCTIMLFTAFVIVDTHALIKDRARMPTQYALRLFLDFVNLFINMVKLLKHLKNIQKKN